MDKFVINEYDALKIYRSIRWASGVSCPYCESNNVYNRGSQESGQINKYNCNDCGKNFNDFTNTLFANSKISFAKLLYVLINIRHKSISQLSKELQIHRNSVASIS